MQENFSSSVLDETDLRLLALLQDDASQSNQALAQAAHVSPATAMRRVRRLVESGIIERQVAILSPQKLGAGLTALPGLLRLKPSINRCVRYSGTKAPSTTMSLLPVPLSAAVNQVSSIW